MLSNKQKTLATISADKRLLANAKLACSALVNHGGWLTRQEIAERISSHNRTMTRIMGRLVDLGLVDERRDAMSSAKSYRWKGDGE